ncbi:MAG: hypothetical protein Q8S92_22880 [Hydrogenophaga sp.]|nr:hypothetical protein [Hydrogenophaga sp.]MDP3351840.1 hypothetical protein [Hydrogenophaga sp.]
MTTANLSDLLPALLCGLGCDARGCGFCSHTSAECLDGAWFEPLRPQQLELPTTTLREVLSPLGNCSTSDFKQVSQRLGAASELDSVLCFHAKKFSTLKL